MEKPFIEKAERLPELNEKEILRLIWKSFELSQGNGQLQKNLLALVRQQYDEVPNIDPEKLQRSFHSKVNNIEVPIPITLDNPKGKKPNSHILAETHQHAEVNPMEMVFQGSIREYIAELLSEEKRFINLDETVNQIWQQDHYYLCDQDGRPNRLDENLGDNTLKDRYFSFGIHYLIKKNSTRFPSYDKVFMDLQTVDPNMLLLEEKIKKIGDIYNTHHPSSPVNIEAYLQQFEP